MSGPGPFGSPAAAFFGGYRSALTSVFCPVISGTYIGIGALAHGFGLDSLWLLVSTMLVWAGPAQVILISGIGTDAALIEMAVAVTLSSIRLLPMTMTLLPLLRRPGTRLRDLLLPTHFTSVSMWVESQRHLPSLPPEHRIPFCNGLSIGFMSAATVTGFAGFYLAAELPALFAGALLFLTPMALLVTTARNAKAMMDKLALVFGLAFGTVLAAGQVQLDLLWAGVGGGVLAYAINRVREATA